VQNQVTEKPTVKIEVECEEVVLKVAGAATRDQWNWSTFKSRYQSLPIDQKAAETARI